MELHPAVSRIQEEEVAREVDANGNRSKTAAEFAREEAEKRLARGGKILSPTLAAVAAGETRGWGDGL
jgi:hypothetical protein